MRRTFGWLVAAALLLVAAPAVAQPAPGLPPGTYLLEFSVLSDDCGHDPFIAELPDSIVIEVDAAGAITLTGDAPWVDMTVALSGDAVTGSGIGEVAGFPDVSVTFEGQVVEPGVIQGELAFGAGSELPGGCPIVWTLTLISETPVETATTTTTTTTSTTTTTAATSGTAGQPATSETTLAATPPPSTPAFPWWILILIGVGLFSGGWYWWWRLTHRDYGLAMTRLLGGLATAPPPPDPAGQDTTPEDTTTRDTTTEDTTTRDTTTEDTTTDDTTTRDTTTEDTTNEDTSDEDTSGEDTSDEDTTEGGDGETRDGTVVFGPRTRPRPDCQPLVDECERRRSEVTRIGEYLKRDRAAAERAARNSERAKAQLEEANSRYTSLEANSNVPRYYERLAQAGIDRVDAQGEADRAAQEAKKAADRLADTEAEFAAAQAAADAACAAAAECLDSPPPEPPAPPSAPPPPEPPAVAPSQRLPQNRCGPEAGERFVECMNRVLARLVVLFGRDPWRATGYLFLSANGGAMDYWVIGEYLPPPCHCPSGRCTASVTLFGVCYPHHVMSDFMYGFCAAWFGLSDTEINAGSAGWKAWKYAANGFEGEFATSSWNTVSKPAYAGGAAAAREVQGNVHLDVRQYHVEDGLAGTAKREDCEPCPCKSERSSDRDFSIERWSWDEPLDVLDKWAVRGGEPPR